MDSPGDAPAWRAARANVLAVAWSGALSAALAYYGKLLDVRFGTRLASFPTVTHISGTPELEAAFQVVSTGATTGPESAFIEA